MFGSAQLGGEFAFLPLLAAIPAIVWHGARTGKRFLAILLRIAAAAYLAAVVAATFFPLPLPPYDVPAGLADYRGLPYPWLAPVPFETLRSSLGLGFEWPAARYLVGNLLAFMPLGLFVRLLRPGRGWRFALAVGLAASLGIELLQLGLSLWMRFPYRVADVDDVILNTTGAMLVWVFLRAFVRRSAEVGRQGRPGP